MCGIAGLIHRGKSSKVGHELQGMLQALKHRGEDSTGYALYGDTDGKNFIMRFKVGENVGEGSTSVAEDVSVYDERKKMVDSSLSEMGAKSIKAGKSDVVFLHFDDVDHAGHAYNYGNDYPKYIDSIEKTDRLIGLVK